MLSRDIDNKINILTSPRLRKGRGMSIFIMLILFVFVISLVNTALLSHECHESFKEMVGYMSGRNGVIILILHQNNNTTNNRNTINISSPQKTAIMNNIRERAIV